MAGELEKAMKGDKVSDKQAKTALGQAVKKIANLTKKADKGNLALKETGGAVLSTAETQGSLFLASMAEGYLGPDKIKVGAVDVRAPLAFVGVGYGLYEVMTGGAGGAHALALGNGLLGSWLASVGVQAGKTLAEKKAEGSGGATPPQVTTTPQPSVQGELLPPAQGALPAPNLGDDFGMPIREVKLTPEPVLVGDEVEDDEEEAERPFGRPRRRGRPRRKGGRTARPKRGGRFVRARKRRKNRD